MSAEPTAEVTVVMEELPDPLFKEEYDARAAARASAASDCTGTDTGPACAALPVPEGHEATA